MPNETIHYRAVRAIVERARSGETDGAPRAAFLAGVRAALEEENRACEDIVQGQRSVDASVGNHIAAESLATAADTIAARRTTRED